MAQRRSARVPPRAASRPAIGLKHNGTRDRAAEPGALAEAHVRRAYTIFHAPGARFLRAGMRPGLKRKTPSCVWGSANDTSLRAVASPTQMHKQRAWQPDGQRPSPLTRLNTTHAAWRTSRHSPRPRARFALQGPDAVTNTNGGPHRSADALVGAAHEAERPPPLGNAQRGRF